MFLINQIIFGTIIFIIFFIFLIFFFLLKKKYNLSLLLSIIFISIIIFITLIPIPPILFFPDHGSELKKKYKEPYIEGTWTDVYIKDKKTVIKQLGNPGIKHTNYTHVSLPTPFRICKKHSCTIPIIISHKVSLYYTIKSIKRIISLNDKIPYFAKIYNLDEKKLRYEQEYIPYMLKDFCPNNWKEQLNDFNNLLKKYGYYIDDVHSKNFGVSEEGILKVFDCEVYTKKELKLQQSLLNIIDGSQKGKANGYKNASNILHWNDGRPGIEDICK